MHLLPHSIFPEPRMTDVEVSRGGAGKTVHGDVTVKG